MEYEEHDGGSDGCVHGEDEEAEAAGEVGDESRAERRRSCTGGPLEACAASSRPVKKSRQSDAKSVVELFSSDAVASPRSFQHRNIPNNTHARQTPRAHVMLNSITPQSSSTRPCRYPLARMGPCKHRATMRARVGLIVWHLHGACSFRSIGERAATLARASLLRRCACHIALGRWTIYIKKRRQSRGRWRRGPHRIRGARWR